MDSDSLLYLRIANKYLAGPLKAQILEKPTLRLVNSVFGVLTRVIASEENLPVRLEQLKSMVRTFRARLAAALPPGSEAAPALERLNRLIESGILSNPREIESCLAKIAGILS